MTDDDKIKNDKGKTEKRSYLCSKCDTIHLFLYRKKPSNTYQAHFSQKFDFIENLSSSFIFNQSFKRNWKNYDIESHKRSSKQ